MIQEKEAGQQLPCVLLFSLLLSSGFVLLSVFISYARVAPAAAQNVNSTEQGSTPNCRYGVARGANAENPFIDALGVGWVLNFGVSPGQPVPAGVEYVPMIRMRQNKNSEGHRLPSYTILTQPLSDSANGLGPLLAAYPGKVWIVGNEVDREVWQDDMEPAIYARAYHDVYHFIKQRDPSARVAIAGLVQVTPNRLEYLDKVWASYIQQYNTPMPVDVWTFHVYVLPEARVNGQGQIVGSNASMAVGTDCYNYRTPSACAAIKWESGGSATLCPQGDVYCYAEHDDMGIFAAQVTAMRQWMKAHGQQNKPLLLAEFSLLYPYVIEGSSCFLQDEYQNCFTPARVNTFMHQAFAYLETAVDPGLGYPLDGNRLVQQWLWYAVTIATDEEPGSASRLVTLNANGDPVAFTSVGTMFQNEIAARPLAVNLLPVNASTIAATGVTSATISVEVMNNGNRRALSNYSVTFYRDPALTDMIGTVIIPGGVQGCTFEKEVVSVDWDGLVPGTNRFWVLVFSSEDSDATDNVTTGFVIVDPEQLYLPIIRR